MGMARVNVSNISNPFCEDCLEFDLEWLSRVGEEKKSGVFCKHYGACRRMYYAYADRDDEFLDYFGNLDGMYYCTECGKIQSDSEYCFTCRNADNLVKIDINEPRKFSL